MEYFGSPEFANLRQAAQKEAKGGGDVLSGFNTANLNVDRSLWNPLEQSFLEIMANNDVRFDGSDLMPARRRRRLRSGPRARRSSTVRRPLLRPPPPSTPPGRR